MYYHSINVYDTLEYQNITKKHLRYSDNIFQDIYYHIETSKTDDICN